jgi:hypothetical protein
LATPNTRDAREIGQTSRGLAILLPLAVCTLIFPLSNTSIVRAMQDDHATAPHATREIGATAVNGYAGQTKCLSCHVGMGAQQSTGMGMAALNPRASNPLDYSTMRYSDGAYIVTMAKGPAGLQMTASDGKETLSIPVRWIFGQGYSGQTFILEQDGKFFESRVSYYKTLSNLDLTIGHPRGTPVSLRAALGRPLPADEVKKCFSCHTSEDIFDDKLDTNQAHPGVTCENCHGAGGQHASKMAVLTAGSDGKDATIFAPELLAPADMNDFCGSCHRTTRDVLNSGIRDIRNIRFQPYRLENSRCYDPSDERTTCIACHDPHRDLKSSPADYDAKCLACHLRRGDKPEHGKAAACPRAITNCVKCHMPKLDLPGAHFAFTDHYIRIVLPNAPYPD